MSGDTLAGVSDAWGAPEQWRVSEQQQLWIAVFGVPSCYAGPHRADVVCDMPWFRGPGLPNERRFYCDEHAREWVEAGYPHTVVARLEELRVDA